MTRHKTFKSIFSDEIKISQIFLGVGLTLFLMNISSILSFLPKEYSYLSFDISVFSSILIIVYSVYIIHKHKN